MTLNIQRLLRSIELQIYIPSIKRVLFKISLMKKTRHWRSEMTLKWSVNPFKLEVYLKVIFNLSVISDLQRLVVSVFFHKESEGNRKFARLNSKNF